MEANRLRGRDPVRLHKERVSKALRIMERRGYDAILVFRPDNVRYIANHRPLFFYPELTFLRNAALLRSNGECTLFVDNSDHKRCLKLYTWLDGNNIIPLYSGFDREIPAVQFVKRVETYLRGAAVVGIDAISFNMLQFLNSMGNIEFRDGNNIMNETRLIKGELEIVEMRAAGRVSESGMSAAIRSLRSGRRECEIWGAACNTMFSLGAESTHSSGIVASGKNGSYPNRLVTTKKIKRGELVYLDVGACVNGYYADMARTVAAGACSREKLEMYETVKMAKAEMEKVLHPTSKTSTVATSGRDVIEDSKFREYCSIVGHGIGMSLAEVPFIRDAGTKQVSQVLKQGMVVTIEPAIWHPRLGGVRLEDTYLITSTGKEKLTRSPPDDELEIR